ncbi:MAG: MFS transporter, partial [Planctomycetaceae bacterium]|nr:MFS transporter [Planctomycetaceae bacterium]
MQNELKEEKWYHGISRYQWMVLIIASLGWVFDVFEGQIFVASMNEAMPSLVEVEPLDESAQTDPVAIEKQQKELKGRLALYNSIAFGAFLIGGALGGIAFGALSDRIGRKKTMSLTILFYSFFTCLSALSQEWWQLAGFRFLVALGVGGEWA